MSNTVCIWDNLPDCLLKEKILSQIYYKIDEKLLNDIKSYHYTMEYIKKIYNNNILWDLILVFETKKDNKEKDELFKNLINKNSNHEYWIRKYISKIGIYNRNYFLFCILKNYNYMII